MKIRFNGEEAGPFDLIGGGPQGSQLGQLTYIVSSDDAASEVDDKDKFKYIDDLSTLELIYLTGILTEYDFINHVASDIGIDQKFLPPQSTQTQINNDNLVLWTEENKMKLNENKSNYMIFTRMREEFASRFTLNNKFLDKKEVTKILGMYISEKPGDWTTNTNQICKRSFSKVPMLSKFVKS